MTIPSKIKSRFEEISSEIFAKSFRKNNQKVCINCVKPRSTKNKFECNNCGCTDFYVLNYQNSSFNIVQFVIYKMAVSSKTKPQFDAVDYFKELPFHNKPIKKPKFKPLKHIS